MKGFIPFTLPSVGCVAAALLGLDLLVAQPGRAEASYQLLPSSVTLEASGARATGSFQVRSTGDEPVAIEIRVTERRMDAQGNETRPDAEADFVVYPPQILLQPGQSQTIRVTWLGDPSLTVEQAYRLIAEQLPIDLGQETVETTGVAVRINALYNYVASLYVAPRGAAADVAIASASHQRLDGQDRLVVQFHNRGTAHQLLTGLHLTLTPEGQPGAAITLGPDQLRGVAGENLLAQHQRQFVLPWPAGLPVGPVTATFELR